MVMALVGLSLLSGLLLPTILLTRMDRDSNLSTGWGGNAVGVVRIEGPIYDSVPIVKIIKAFRRSSTIKAIVLRIDSPGGSVGASEEIYREARAAWETDKKPVVASFGNAAASGGYYVASGAQEIITNAGTLTGSIGVIAMLLNFEQTIGYIGIRPQVIKSGEHKDTGSPYRPMLPEDRQILQNLVFDSYRQFMRAILTARAEAIAKAIAERPDAVAAIVAASTTKGPGQSIESEAFTTGALATELGVPLETETALRNVADGRILTGEQAVTLGLADRIGTLYDAIDRAAELGGIEGRPTIVDRRPRPSVPSLLGSAGRTLLRELGRTEATVEFRGP